MTFAWHAESPGAKLQVGRSSKVIRLTSLIERPSSPKHMRGSKGSALSILARGRGSVQVGRRVLSLLRERIFLIHYDL
jgi:hypothetical protein